MSVSVMQLYSRAMSANSLDSRGPPNIMPDEPFKPRIRPDGKAYYEKDKAGSEIHRVFQWDVKEDTLLPLDTVARRRMRQKNFITLNRDEVKRIEDRVRDAQKKVRDDLKTELSKPLWKSDKYDNVNSKVAQEINHQNVNVNGHKVVNKMKYPIANEPGRQSRPQTGKKSHNTKLQNGVLPNGVAHHQHEQRSKSVEPLHIKDSSHRPGADGQKTRQGSGHKNNFVQSNAQAAARTSIKRAPSATELDQFKKKIDEQLKNHPNGQLPEYLKGRKKALQQANDAPKMLEAPPGHVLMNYEEKSRTLASLQRAEADLLKRFNSLPVRTDTDFLKRKKQVLQRQLEEVDEAIKIFSRPKVFVKTDQY